MTLHVDWTEDKPVDQPREIAYNTQRCRLSVRANMYLLSNVQCRAARALLGWTQITLADESHVSARAIQDFEAGKRVPTHATLMAIQHALEIAGVQFELLNNGVALVEGFRGITVDPRKIGLDDEIESR